MGDEFNYSLELARKVTHCSTNNNLENPPDIVKNLTVTWEDEEERNVNELQGYSFVEGKNVGGTQTSTLTIGKATKNATYTCTLYPYEDEPYSTPVKLEVSNSERALRLSAVLSALLIIWRSF